VRLKILGCGDAFGSGGRFNTSFMVTAPSARFLVDCGASTMVAMRRFGVDPNEIDAILISHLHGDHFGGLPFLLLDAQFISRRRRPLVIAGPVGLGERLPTTMEALFPGSSAVERRFAVELVEMAAAEETRIGALTVTPQEARHPSGAPPLALRIDCDGRTLCYTGDTEWVDGLIPAARGADLLIAECYMYDRKVPFHLDLMTLRERAPDLGAKRILLTHLGPSMLSRSTEEIGFEVAEDGLELEI
jgi:ribonuclease BN (tRNA processing enzyme)